MSRLFRLLEKKRGERRTVSNWVGGVGELLFFGVLLILGLSSLAVLIAGPLTWPKYYSLELGKGYWLSLLVVLTLIIVGGSGTIWAMLRFGTSDERRQAFAGKAKSTLQDAPPRGSRFPSIPDDEGITNSPGTELAYRLPPAHSPGWQLAASTTFCLLWNIIAIVLLAWTIGSFVAGMHLWFLTVVTSLFVLVGGGSLAYLIRQVLTHTGLAPTMVEIEAQPLQPGKHYSVVLSQAGNFRVDWIELWLVCEEEATFNQGTDIRTELGRVYEKLVFQEEDFKIETASSYVRKCSVEIPQEAMHSFQGNHHAIHWRLLVRGSVEGWPEFERAFPIIVHPGELTRLPRAHSASSPPLAGPHAVGFGVRSAGVSA